MLAQGNEANPNYSTAYVLSADGSKYALVVDDPAKLAASAALYSSATYFDPATGGWQTGNSISTLFDQVEKSFNPNSLLSGPIAEEAFERAQAFILSTFDTGISLLKADANGNFHEIHTIEDTVSTPMPITYSKVDCN